MDQKEWRYVKIRKDCGFVVVVLGGAFQRVWIPGLAVFYGNPIAPAHCHLAGPRLVSRDYTLPPPGATEQDLVATVNPVEKTSPVFLKLKP